VTSRARLLFVALLFHTAAFANVEVKEFASPEMEARYRGLVAELRCLVCQNQNLADSDADLAKDLRREVHKMIGEGRSDQEIIDFMVARYGDFVLYRPPVKGTTALLWLGPALLAVGGLAFLFVVLRRRTAPAGQPELSDEERNRADAILKQDVSRT